MRLLLIHANRFSYEATEATRVAEEVPADRRKGEMGEGAVAFCSIERDDEGKERFVAARAVTEIRTFVKKVHASEVMLYPYAHLSSDLGSPDSAKRVLTEMEAELAKELRVHRSPFGWYKRFEIACKGHPLSELSREIRVSDEEVARAGGADAGAGTREEAVAAITSRHLILTPEGDEHPITITTEGVTAATFLERYPLLKRFLVTEELKQKPKKAPPSIEAMQRLELVDYEPASDAGHFRLYPKGHLVFDLLRQWAHRIAVERLGCIQIDTPILYDWSLPDIRAQGQSFHERHYRIRTQENREFVLRFAGDFGLFRMMGGATLSYRHLPLRVYEFSKSFRFEQKGELGGLKRLRAFHMPDIHCFTADLEQGWAEYQELYRNYDELAAATGIEYVVVFRIVDEFYSKYRGKLIELLKKSGRPALIEVLSGMKHYWAVKHEFQGIDSLGGACQLSTVQLDVADGERYGIVYTDDQGKKRGCIICHSSVGSLERWMYAILEDAMKKEKPELPWWLAPTQVRLIAVADAHVAACETLAASIPCRVDIDDRDLQVGRKIREAEREWIPMIVVVGDKETGGGTLPVRLRDGSLNEFTAETLAQEAVRRRGAYPDAVLPLPRRVSRRPIFRG